MDMFSLTIFDAIWSPILGSLLIRMYLLQSQEYILRHIPATAETCLHLLIHQNHMNFLILICTMIKLSFRQRDIIHHLIEKKLLHHYQLIIVLLLRLILLKKKKVQLKMVQNLKLGKIIIILTQVEMFIKYYILKIMEEGVKLLLNKNLKKLDKVVNQLNITLI